MLRAAIVGLGRWGQRLVLSCQGKSELLRFVAAATRHPETASEFAERHGLRLAGDYEGLLADRTVDAVVLATPHSQHARQVEAAAGAGKHVFVEKPFTLDKASAEKAAAAARRAGVTLAFGHNRRFLPALSDLKFLIADGELGAILHVEGNFSSGSGLRYVPGMWCADPAETPAGGMTQLGIHVLDAFIHLLGRIDRVTAQCLRRVVTVPVDDTTAVLCRFASGMSGSLVTMTATAPIWRLQVFGARGWAEMRGEDSLAVQRLERELEVTDYPATDTERAELEGFATAIAGKTAYPVSADEAIHGVAVLEAVIRSAATGKTVKLG